jgi:hypothetical protein
LMALRRVGHVSAITWRSSSRPDSGRAVADSGST